MSQTLPSEIEAKMNKTLVVLKSDLAKIRTGRASVGLLDHVQVDYYGAPMPINQVANVTVLDGRTLGVQPWEKSMVAVVEKAIRESDLGLNPSSAGELIRVPMPELTEERRRELVKLVRQNGENTKVAIRNLRREGNQKLKNLVQEKTISEDDERRGQDAIQKLTDQKIKDIDTILSEKEQEMMQI